MFLDLQISAVYYSKTSFYFLYIGSDRPTLKYLYRFVRPYITTQWYEIGLELLGEEDEYVLNIIMANYSNDPDKCTREMLQLWLARKSNPTWDQLIDVFRLPDIQLEFLASEIEKLLSKGNIINKEYSNIINIQGLNVNFRFSTFKYLLLM